MQLLGAAVLMAVPAIWAGPSERPSAIATINLAALILLSTTFAYILYFFLLKEIGPTRTASVTFIIPLFGTLWAVVFLNEPVSIGMLFGMAIIFASVRLVTGKKTEKRGLIRPLTLPKIGEP